VFRVDVVNQDVNLHSAHERDQHHNRRHHMEQTGVRWTVRAPRRCSRDGEGPEADSEVRWTVEGAQAMLPMRALYPKDHWEAFLEFRVEQEQARLYRKDAA
jgi:hypothetical protein